MQQTRTARANPVASLRESYGTLSRFLTDDPVRQLWVSPFPSYPDVHKGRSLYFSGGCSFSALCIASSYGLYDVLQQILSSGIDPIDPERGVNCVDGGGRSPLSWAASRGYMGVALALLDCGADIETRDNRGKTPLSWAAENEHNGVVQLLLDRGADIETRDSGNGQTPLSWAAMNGRNGVVQLLLGRGADTERRDSEWGRTPLSWAAERGRDRVVQLLLDRGANIESGDNWGLTPLPWGLGSAVWVRPCGAATA